MAQTIKDYLSEEISKKIKTRRINEQILNDNEKIKEFISNYPFFFSVLHHSIDINIYALLDSFTPHSNYNNWIEDESFMVTAVDLFLKNLSKYWDNDEEIDLKQEHELHRSYTEKIYSKFVEREIYKLEKMFLINKAYDELHDESVCYILYPLDEIIGKCLEDKELFKHLEKVKKKTLLDFTLKQN